MLLVETYIDKSNINGIGLFTNQDIKNGEITWKYTPGFDLSFTKDEIDKMSPLLKDFIETYAALSMISDKYILGSDNVRFTNHSNNPNLDAVKLDDEMEKVAMANRDIKKGEELTINYKTFDVIDATSNKDYLDNIKR